MRLRTTGSRALTLLFAVLGLIGLSAGPAEAQLPTITLSLGTTTVTFPHASPETTPSIAAVENPISVTVTVSNSASPTWTLTVLPGSDLVSGSDNISINRVFWTATGATYNSGRLHRTQAQTVGQGFLNGAFAGTLSFFFENEWADPTGTYSCVITYTATLL